MSTGTPEPPFTDIQQSINPESDGNGGIHDVWTVHATSPSGTRFHVKVPDSHYSADNVATALMDKVGHVEAVHALEHGHRQQLRRQHQPPQQ